jgi:chemotaxis response regulator CheB
MLRVLVVDDRVDVRQLFAAVLDGQSDLEVVSVRPGRWPMPAPC